MTKRRNGDAIIAESFLEVRAKLLEVAATLDRIDRGCESGSLGGDAASQRELLSAATKILLTAGPDRAANLQQLFSRDYDSDWRNQFGLGSD